ncbi:hypothetical protein OB69_11395 [Roseivirga seohaensis subsp. aquiponti]|uniref:Immunity MXAN-0049 protein domain-containing protein n=1 Tax=Roseivirga seohaensis subsp. aquiponti TaxID=1566026 RepID=A0A0L8AJB4_9BACT|nr:DUF1629 domain-containing protein [Roseivirga seohaensis]KOF02528.1 hypothetical protein OB69_11395 [Roseivirga seohaensis subsp. aquiponti]
MYYRIKESIDTKVIGSNYPQVEEAIFPVSIHHPQFIDRIRFEKAQFEPIMAKAKLVPRAKFTDLISTSTIGFTLKLLISERLKEIFELYRAEGIEFFATEVVQKSIAKKYWVMSIYTFDYEALDLTKSEIILTKNSFEEIKEISIHSTDQLHTLREDVRKEYGEDFSFRIKQLDFLPNNQDFLFLSYVSGGIGYYVSQRLRDQLEESGITGIDFREL